MRNWNSVSERRRRSDELTHPKPSIIDVVASECRDHPDIEEPLRLLAVGFQNRTFLPNLRDVQRFLERTNSKPGKLKSREAAIPVLFRSLGKLTRDELLDLAQKNDVSGDSDFAILAREIMKARGGNRPRPLRPDDKPRKS